MKHTWNDVIASRNFMYDDESAKKVLEDLYSELATEGNHEGKRNQYLSARW